MAEAEWQKPHREIEELHRTILARMDASDRRAAERGKQRKKRRAELRAKLRAYGLREVSSEELLASVKRLSDTVDRVLDARRRSAGTGAMAEAEWKGRVDRLDEVTIVQARILERLERKYDDAIQRHDEEMRDLRTALEKFTSGVEKLRFVVASHEDGIAELRATQVALMKTFDQFIRGQEGNGRKQ